MIVFILISCLLDNVLNLQGEIGFQSLLYANGSEKLNIYLH